jgi:DNA-binding NtrC family response regulator
MIDSLREMGCDVLVVDHLEEALEAVEPDRFDLVLLDLDAYPEEGVEVLAEIRRRDPGLSVAVMAEYDRLPEAVEAARQGGYGCLRKPFDRPELQLFVERALAYRQLEREVRVLRARLSIAAANGHLLGPEPGSPLADGSPEEGGEELTLEELEKRHITRVLQQARNYDEAARILGIDPATLWRKRRRYGIA